MYIETVPNRNSTPTTLLRESYRQHGKVKKRTLANLTHWPKHLVQDFNLLLKGGTAIADLNTSLTIQRSLPHGAVVAVLGSLKKLGLHRLIDRKNSRHSQLVLAMIVARILEPSSKLATARGLSEIQGEIPANTLVDTLALDKVNEDDLYEAMDWLLEHQPRIEQALAKRHLDEGALVMYDLTSVYMEGRKCELAKRGYSRDGKKGKLQVEFGLLCNADGCPVAVEVYAGNTADPNTVGSQIYKLRERFGLSKVVLVGDRGMLTEARIREEVKPAGLDWISALRGPAIRKLMEAKAVQLSLFDEKDLVEIR
ncbi:MAG: IS1634 family transposase, partial [Gammaproteobacteria bacterium]|nr:IS1634 family transposase [Gammaproteobacteria bacterium]